MKFRALPVSIQLDDAAIGKPELIPSDVQIMRTGRFYFENGGDIEVTSQLLSEMVNNFNANVRGLDLAIDYKHDAEDIAAGWIKNLYLKNNNQELWATVDWTPNGRKVLSDKEFRYLSADFHRNYKHNETKKSYGPTLLGAGLTNRPVIKQMEPIVQLSEKPTKGNNMKTDQEKIAELEASNAALKAQLDKANQGGDAATQLADLQAKTKEQEKELEGYKAAAAKAEEARILSEKKSAFDKLMMAGKAVEAQREAFMSGDLMKFSESFIQPNTGAAGSSKDAPPTQPKDAAEAQEQIIQLAEKMVTEKKVKSISEGQRLALKENPELAKKIYG